MLTIIPALAYAFSVTAKSVSGIGLPFPERTGAHPKRFFCARVQWRVSWGLLRERRSPDGKANPVASVTLLIGLNGDGFDTNPEITTMDIHTKVAPAIRSTSPVLDNALDAAALGKKCVADLGALFLAIRLSCDKHSTAYDLAGIGSYLADDWANLIDCNLEEIAEKRGGHEH